MTNENILNWARVYYGADSIHEEDGMYYTNTADGTCIGRIEDIEKLKNLEEWAAEQKMLNKRR